MYLKLTSLLLLALTVNVQSQVERTVGKFREVFAWRQLTYDINGRILSESVRNSSDDSSTFFIQENNVPMGVERVGSRLFVTVPRRRYGVVSTLNYIDLPTRTRSPALKPYPDLETSRSMVSVYRTRADQCGRLWMVDNGMLEIPNNYQQIQPPAIVIFDIQTNRLLRRYNFRSEDIPTPNLTPTGLASITVDVIGSNCQNTYAYMPDLATYGIIVYSFSDNDSWRVTHNYLHFTPLASTFNVAGVSFQWSDGIFSMTTTPPGRDTCKTAYFHPLASTQEYSVNTCTLRNRTASNDTNYWTLYSYVGDRGQDSQCTMHDMHQDTRVIFFSEVGRNAISCWNTGKSLNPQNMGILAQDSIRLSYPSDLHVTEDEVWFMANTFPRFIYSRLDQNQYNFYIYRGEVRDLISGTVCEAPRRIYDTPSDPFPNRRF